MEGKHTTNITQNLNVDFTFKGLEKIKEISADKKFEIKVACTGRTSVEVYVLES